MIHVLQELDATIVIRATFPGDNGTLYYIKGGDLMLVVHGDPLIPKIQGGIIIPELGDHYPPAEGTTMSNDTRIIRLIKDLISGYFYTIRVLIGSRTYE